MHMVMHVTYLRCLFALLCIVGAVMLAEMVPVARAAQGPGWYVNSMAQPTRFQVSDTQDEYWLTVANVGSVASSGTVTLTDELPSGVTTSATPGSNKPNEGVGWSCSPGAGQSKITCTLSAAVAALAFTKVITVPVEVSNTAESPLENKVTVEGGVAASAPSASTSELTEISSVSPLAGTDTFGFGVYDGAGQSDVQAGDHPNALTTSFHLNDVINTRAQELGTPEYLPAGELKDVVVELPRGLVGDPLVTGGERCPEALLKKGEFESNCPASTQIGVGLVDLGAPKPYSHVIRVYNLVPEAGYPAEFGFNFADQTVVMFAGVGPGPEYGLRITVPGVPQLAELSGASLIFFGDPAVKDGGTTGSQAFLTNPMDCSAGSSPARMNVTSWEEPSRWDSRETRVYPEITGCNLLQFEPTLPIQPEETQTDTPSGYEVDLKVPQSPNQFPDLATPELQDTTVTLPTGVSISPSAADGLEGCRATGPEGLNVGSGKAGPEGRDEGEPEATELGAGHPDGNSSPYDDGLYHNAHGHCPAASQIGTVELETPLLPARSLSGRAYLAQPACGGEGQPECTEQLAEEGRMYGLYLEIEGEGVIVKLKGTVEAGGNGQHSKATGLAPGQLRTTFKDNPQLPFSELKLRLKGGARAPLSNPQSCGSFTTHSVLTSWASNSVNYESSFGVGGCGGSPFAPAFNAGTAAPLAGAFSPFTLTFSRHDGEQDLSALTVTTPPGLLGVLKSVVQCPEQQASQGTCGEGSLIGHTEVAAGAGSHPFWVQGRVYLTGPYGGAPFGLSIVTPAKAGPFNLGNVIVRAKIEVNRNTTALTVTSDPLPQIIDGVPLRIQTVNATIDRPGFIFNPTNCAQQAITGVIGSAQNTKVAVSSPFAVAGCANLPFKPSFKAGTQAKTSKANGASLTVKVGSSAGQANIAKVRVTLPKQLPARLTTLQKACTEAQFNVNPAGCPAPSDIGNATAVTPELAHPLTGPAYLVSHGGAAFPDVVFVLQGEGITLYLDGSTNIKKGITTSTFNSVPDAPISTFETTFPEGPHSVLATDISAKAKGSLCGQALTMPTTITGQNGAVVTQTTKIAVAGCPSPLQQLRADLKACRKKAKGHKRTSCEHAARQKYALAVK
jgi:hypothetical protein